MEILLIDDQPLLAEKLRPLIESQGHQTHYFHSGLEVLGFSDEQMDAYDMAIIDRQMPDCDGLEIGKKLKARRPSLVTLMLTADDTRSTIIRALRDSKFDDYLSKRELVKDLVSGRHLLDDTLYRAEALIATRKQLEKTEQALMREVQLSHTLREQSVTISKGMVGCSQAFKGLQRLIHKVAPTDATVLIHGETGTGKELVAREIHKSSARTNAPFVAINCAAIPRELLESELFGHEKGAFTGANNSREGFIKMADGGTLFLDEIGDMPMELQTKLLRVLQEKEITPVGGKKNIKVDVRIVSATHQDLKDKVQLGHFREDLYYRLNVFPISVPPLRERLQDLGLLIEYFIQRKSTHIKGITSEALEMLKQRPWSGNIRELENVIERAMIVTMSEQLRPEDFLEETSFLNMKGIPNNVGGQSLDHSQERLSGTADGSVPPLGGARSSSNEPLWDAFEANGFKLWRIINELSLREQLKELLQSAVYEKRGRFAVLLLKKEAELPIKVQYVHCKTHRLEEIEIVFHFYDDYEKKPSANGQHRKRAIPLPDATVYQPVLKGLPDTYIFDILYPKVRSIAWDHISPRWLMRATILRYAQIHASQKSLKSVLGEVLSFLVDPSLAKLLNGLRQDGQEAVRACLTSPSHIFAGIPTRLRVHPDFIEQEIQKIYPHYSRPASPIG
ncbi:MAG: sigma-54-dependent Fis family transcriptional regulator [SAR324 cluster bacterium]|nr:sigma-54-dependent Fis family transcriptional regulator [SAR324 cluster bacterium]